MSLEDESLLSAYLDGELEESEHRSVEESIRSDLTLAGKLRDLRAVRLAVSGLSRPTGPGVSELVLRLLADRTPRRRPWRVSHVGLSRLAAAAVGAAAGLLFLVLIPWSPRKVEIPGRVSDGGFKSAGEKTPSAELPVEDPRTGRLVVDSSAAGPGRNSELPAARVSGPTSPSEPADPARADAQRARELLDDPRLRHVFLVTDVIDDPARNKLPTVLEESTQHEFYRITVTQGIVIDPKHPGEATVYALVLEDRQLGALRNRLRHIFTENLEERDLEPEIVAQLADIGQVVSLPPHPLPELIQSPTPLRMALRRDGEPTPEQERSSPNVGHRTAELAAGGASSHVAAPGAGGPQEPLANLRPADGIAGERKSPLPPPARPRPGLEPADHPASLPRGEGTVQPVVVLVWITAPRSG
jgi:hypothetical protein